MVTASDSEACYGSEIWWKDADAKGFSLEVVEGSFDRSLFLTLQENPLALSLATAGAAHFLHTAPSALRPRSLFDVEFRPLLVHNAGHIVPMDEPKAALEMLKRWTSGKLAGGTEPENLVA